MKSLILGTVFLASSVGFASPCSQVSGVDGYKAELQYDVENNVNLIVTHPGGATQTVYCGEPSNLQCQDPEFGQVFQTILVKDTLNVTFQYRNDVVVFGCQL